MKKISSPFKLIKESYDLFSKKENFITFIKLYLPSGILSAISLLFIYIPFLSDFFKTSTGSVFMSVFNIITFLVGILVNLVGIMAILRIINGNKVVFGSIYKEAFRNYIYFLLFNICLFLIYGVSVILLVFPVILTTTWFAFSKLIFVEKKANLKFALKESKKIVKGKFWKVFIRILVFGLFSLLGQMVFTILPYGIGIVICDLFGAIFVIPYILLFKELKVTSVTE